LIVLQRTGAELAPREGDANAATEAREGLSGYSVINQGGFEFGRSLDHRRSIAVANRCLLSGAKRKTLARIELFPVLTLAKGTEPLLIARFACRDCAP
jgi:hypothetical protein